MSDIQGQSTVGDVYGAVPQTFDPLGVFSMEELQYVQPVMTGYDTWKSIPAPTFGCSIASKTVFQTAYAWQILRGSTSGYQNCWGFGGNGELTMTFPYPIKLRAFSIINNNIIGHSSPSVTLTVSASIDGSFVPIAEGLVESTVRATSQHFTVSRTMYSTILQLSARTLAGGVAQLHGMVLDAVYRPSDLQKKM